jgi:hypothetical protein
MRHPHGFKRSQDDRFDFLQRQAEIQWAKSDIIIDRGHKQLVIRVLKDHTDRSPHRF